MKYFPVNPVMDMLIEKIKKSIHLTMNGVTSERMKLGGINYKKNFGLSIPQLKQLAIKHEQNHELAQRLWALKIRETMILACMLQPKETFTKEMAEDWVNDCANIELIEQASMHLFSKLPYAAEKALEWINYDNEKTCVCGFTLAARIINTFTEEQTDQLMIRAMEKANNNEFMMYNAIAICLRKIATKNQEFATKVNQAVKLLNQSQKSTQYIYQEIKTTIDFYYNNTI